MYKHQPVLLAETMEYVMDDEDGIYIDGTLGRGGHTAAMLEKINNRGLVIAIDRDLEAIRKVEDQFDNIDNLYLIHDNFINIPRILDEFKIDKVNGMIFDLGFSSPQIDKPQRGFSYNKEGPLDMRMNRNQKLTAADIVNKYTGDELTEIIRDYGEERWASRIAKFIVKDREQGEIRTTFQLVQIIKDAIPASARRGGGHPARRTFQALRIATNDELNQLKMLINRTVPRLQEGGRICIISFHSLEDRIVKHTFRDLARDCVCPPDFPICVCDHEPSLKIITGKPVRASAEEVEENPRARSAKMRVAEKI